MLYPLVKGHNLPYGLWSSPSFSVFGYLASAILFQSLLIVLYFLHVNWGDLLSANRVFLVQYLCLL